MRWIDVLERFGGIATARQLASASVLSRDLTAAVRSVRLTRPRRGFYALPSASASGIAAVRAGGRLSCVSAARSYGLWGGTDPRLHLRVPSHATRLPEGEAKRHWVDGEDHRECWRVSIGDCLRSTARCASFETAVAVADTAISAGLITLRELTTIFESEPKRSRGVADAAHPGSDSGVESIARQRLTARGHVIEQQLTVPGVGRVDMRIDGVLYLEIDGFAYHSDRGSFERDRARDTALAVAGRQRLRVTARQVLEEWGEVCAAIESLLAFPENASDAPEEAP